MKKFEIYKNIRKQAMIMGLSIAHFALMMTVVIGSLLSIIFSFNFYGIVVVFIINAIVYVVLTHFSKNTSLLDFKKVFPLSISNKKPCLADRQESQLHYEQD